jgi:ABC-type transport system involved in cytochrome bd biosynthesis fused ATPase/permease subunit
MEFFPALVVLLLAPEVYFPLRNAASLFHASADGGAALTSLTEIQAKHPQQRSMAQQPSVAATSLSWKQWSSPFGGGEIPAASLQSGDICIIRGGSGLGKTTFLNSLLALNEKGSYNSDIGWIPQNPALISGSVRELFSLVDSSLTDQSVTDLLERVGLAIDQLPQGLDTQISGVGEKSGHISGGQKRRLAIARALAAKPSLIIADEPTADLDPASAQEVLTILRESAAQGAIVIAVLHAPDQRIDCAIEIEMVQR